jgi:hypothetical protein
VSGNSRQLTLPKNSREVTWKQYKLHFIISTCVSSSNCACTYTCLLFYNLECFLTLHTELSKPFIVAWNKKVKISLKIIIFLILIPFLWQKALFATRVKWTYCAWFLISALGFASDRKISARKKSTFHACPENSYKTPTLKFSKNFKIK